MRQVKVHGGSENATASSTWTCRPFGASTRHYIPAHFVREVTVRQDDALILRMEGGISLSEEPSFRFDFRPTGEPIRVEAVDTEGDSFRGHGRSSVGKDPVTLSGR